MVHCVSSIVTAFRCSMIEKVFGIAVGIGVLGLIAYRGGADFPPVPLITALALVVAAISLGGIIASGRR